MARRSPGSASSPSSPCAASSTRGRRTPRSIITSPRTSWFPFNIGPVGSGPFGKALTDALGSPGFYYSFAYCVAIILFGYKRIRRRKTPYVTRQTLALTAVQVIPLFLLPYFVLPWMGNAGVFDHGILKPVGDNLFPDAFLVALLRLRARLAAVRLERLQLEAAVVVARDRRAADLRAHPAHRSAAGARAPTAAGSARCGALAETLGDTQRQKMPHGPVWNRLNMVGPGDPGHLLLALRRAHRRLERARIDARPRARPRLRRALLQPLGLRLLPRGRHVPRRHRRRRHLLLVLGPRLVPLRLPARRAHAHLRALLALPHLRREEEVHLVQRLHLGLPPGHRRHELRQQGAADGGPRVRALLGLRPVVPDGDAAVRAPRRRRARRSTTAWPPRRCSWPKGQTARSDCG